MADFKQKSTLYRVMMTLLLASVVSLCITGSCGRTKRSPMAAKKNKWTGQRPSTLGFELKTTIDRTPDTGRVRSFRGQSAFLSRKCIWIGNIRNNVNKGLTNVRNLRRAHRGGEGKDPLWVLPASSLPGGWRWRAESKFLRQKAVSGPLVFPGW